MSRTPLRRIFNRFRAHRAGTFLEYDHEKRSITWRPDDSPGKVTEWIQHGLEIAPETFRHGQRLRVQDGEMNTDSSNMRGGLKWFATGARGSMRQVSIYTGCACIDAIAHEDPVIDLMALRLMEQALGPEALATHIQHFREGASTRQTEIVVRLNRHDLTLRIRNGVLTASRRLSNSVCVDRTMLSFDAEGMPDTVTEALAGRALRDLVAHPVTQDPDIVIDRIVRATTDGRAWAHVVPVLLTPDQAIARLVPTLAIAA